MAATLEQKRQQKRVMRRAVQIIRDELPDAWELAYRTAREELAAADRITP